ncbi:MAG TPA: TFIIB-type zinc finger domain-containing protein [Gammaproteobacteria bacterium]|nr:TFIIB-type zinc finger domain-containing protein [Gammaproteobacteria bacterium]
MKWLDRFWNKIIEWLFDEQPDRAAVKPRFVRPMKGSVQRQDGLMIPVAFIPVAPFEFQAVYESTGEPVKITTDDVLHVDVIGPHQSVIVDLARNDIFYEDDESPADIVEKFEIGEKGYTGALHWTGDPVQGFEFDQRVIPDPLIGHDEGTDIWSIRCPICNNVSYNIEDVKNRYCGHCHATIPHG